jgi:hypothetical protein
MAQCFPATVTQSYFTRDDGKPDQTEWYVFCRLRDALPAEWVIMPRVYWFWKENRGECDFIIIDPSRGILDLEVKTGVEYVPSDGYLHPHSDPVKQAEKNRKNIADILANSRLFSSPAPIGYALCFPGLTEVGGTAFDAGCVLVDADLEDGHLARQLSCAFNFWKVNFAFSHQLMQKVTTLLAPLHGPSLDQRKWVGKYVSQKVSEATAKQYEALKSVLGIDSPYTRVAINGCAGSGKTRIAVEAARSLAIGGMSVLLACFNTNLATVLERDSRICDWVKSGSIEVRPYYSLGDYFLVQANASRNREGDPPLTKRRDWNNKRYDQDVAIAIRETPCKRFDAIIIDEGQDFDPQWVDTISQTLRDPRNGRLVFLYDEQQQIFPLRGDAARVVKNLEFQVHKELVTNCRNPAPIHNEVMKHHPNGRDFIAMIDEGLEPEYITLPLQAGRSWSASALFRAYRDALAKWLYDEKPRARDVVLIAPHGKDRISYWSEHAEVGDYLITRQLEEWLDPDNRRYVFLSTTRTFKGLEAPYVVVIELEGINELERERLLYTTLSRAKQQLVYMLPQGLKI